MFGTLRFVLALLVVASHADVSHELDLGNTAVTVFYLLSGFVMTATIRRYYGSRNRYGWFLLDRAGRIYPQYLLWVFISVLYGFAFDRTWHPLGIHPIIENILMVPAMYGVYDLRPWLTGVRYISPTWSLSLEWHFYMLLPMLLLVPRARLIAAIISLGIFTMATLDVVAPDIYGYRLLPGVLFIFLIGSVIYDGQHSGAISYSGLFWPFIYLLVLGIIANYRGTLYIKWTAEVYIGILTGAPLLIWLSRRSPHSFDTWFGNISYGVFLCHSLLLQIIYRLGVFTDRWVILVLACSFSAVLSAIAYHFVEAPFLAWRHTVRRRSIARS